DGVEMKMIDRNGEEIGDVPTCQPQFMPSTKRKRTYIDFRHNRRYQYLQDKEEEEAIEVIDTETDYVIDSYADVHVPVIGDVAAGLPITAIQHYGENICLIDDWVIQPQHTYALNVTGDSMVGTGIDKGDLVIVHKQENVTN